MKQLIILGSGVHAAEMSEIVGRINQRSATWDLLGYVTTDKNQVRQCLNGYPVLGTKEVLTQYPDALLVPDNEWPTDAMNIDERFASLIDPETFVSRNASVGRGCVVYPHSFLGFRATLEDRVFCLDGCIINHDDHISHDVVLASRVVLAGSVHIGAGSYLGQACNIRQFVNVGARSLVGMGSVVINDVAPNTVVVGNPARRLRERYPKPQDG